VCAFFRLDQVLLSLVILLNLQAGFVVGPLGFEPRIANAPGWYTEPSAEELTQDTQICQSSNAIRRPQEQAKYQAEIIKTLLKTKNEGKVESTLRCFSSHLRILNKNTDLQNRTTVETYLANNIKDPQANSKDKPVNSSRRTTVD
jgi:hypothetical protein